MKKNKQHELIQEMFHQITDCSSGQLFLIDEKKQKTVVFNFNKQPFKPRWTASAKEAMEYYTIKDPKTLAAKRKAGVIKSKAFGAHRFKYFLE